MWSPRVSLIALAANSVSLATPRLAAVLRIVGLLVNLEVRGEPHAVKRGQVLIPFSVDVTLAAHEVREHLLHVLNNGCFRISDGDRLLLGKCQRWQNHLCRLLVWLVILFRQRSQQEFEVDSVRIDRL